MHISGIKTKQPPHIIINGTVIDAVSSAKLLGLHIADTLKWKTHLDHSINAASKPFFFIVRLKRAKISTKSLYQIYCSIFRPILTYSCPTTINVPHQLCIKITRLEKRFLRLTDYRYFCRSHCFELCLQC